MHISVFHLHESFCSILQLHHVVPHTMQLQKWLAASNIKERKQIYGVVVFKDLLTKIKLGQYKMPSAFPDDVKDLISRMLQVDPDKRLTIEQIKHHKVFRTGL